MRQLGFPPWRLIYAFSYSCTLTDGGAEILVAIFLGEVSVVN